MFAYSPETSALLPLAIERALEGDYAPLVGQAEILNDELADIAGNGMQLSVICAEDADLLVASPEDAQTDSRRHARATCCRRNARSGRAAAGQRISTTPVHSDKPVLMLAGELDPVTPPRYGERDRERSAERPPARRERPGPQRDGARLLAATGRSFR